MNEERVDRAARALYERRFALWNEGGYSWEWVQEDVSGTIGTFEYNRLYDDVRCVLDAVKEGEST